MFQFFIAWLLIATALSFIFLFCLLYLEHNGHEYLKGIENHRAALIVLIWIFWPILILAIFVMALLVMAKFYDKYMSKIINFMFTKIK